MPLFLERFDASVRIEPDVAVAVEVAHRLERDAHRSAGRRMRCQKRVGVHVEESIAVEDQRLRGPHAGHGQRDSASRAQRLTLDREIEVEVRFLPFDPCLDLLVQVAQRQYDFPESVPVQAAQQIIEERPAAYGGHTFGDGAYRIPQACSEAAGQNDAGRICDGCRAGVCVCVVHAFVNGSCVRSLRERRASVRFIDSMCRGPPRRSRTSERRLRNVSVGP